MLHGYICFGHSFLIYFCGFFFCFYFSLNFWCFFFATLWHILSLNINPPHPNLCKVSWNRGQGDWAISDIHRNKPKIKIKIARHWQWVWLRWGKQCLMKHWTNCTISHIWDQTDFRILFVPFILSLPLTHSLLLPLSFFLFIYAYELTDHNFFKRIKPMAAKWKITWMKVVECTVNGKTNKCKQQISSMASQYNLLLASEYFIDNICGRRTGEVS